MGLVPVCPQRSKFKILLPLSVDTHKDSGSTFMFMKCKMHKSFDEL